MNPVFRLNDLSGLLRGLRRTVRNKVAKPFKHGRLELCARLDGARLDVMLLGSQGRGMAQDEMSIRDVAG